MIFKRTSYFELIKFCTINLFIMRNICVQKIWRKLQFYFFRTHLASDFTPNFCHHIFRLLTIFLRVLDSVYVPKMKGISQKPRGVEQNIHVVSCNFESDFNYIFLSSFWQKTHELVHPVFALSIGD